MNRASPPFKTMGCVGNSYIRLLGQAQKIAGIICCLMITLC